MNGQYKSVVTTDIMDDNNNDIETNTQQHKIVLTFSCKRLVLLLLFFISTILLSIKIINHDRYDHFEDNSYTNSTASLKSISNSGKINIALLGDSLIAVPWGEYGLKDKITEQISSNVNLCSYGRGGSKIEQILKRVDTALKECQPQYVILFWDSDCSDIDESTMTPDEVTELRDQYKANVLEVCSRIIKFESVSGLAVGGPVLLGEGPITVLLPPRMLNKVFLFYYHE